MALIYFINIPKYKLYRVGFLFSASKNDDLSFIFLGRALAKGWISKEGLIAQIY